MNWTPVKTQARQIAAEVYGELTDTEAAALRWALVLAETEDEREAQNREAAGVVEWLHENNAAALYGDAVIDRMNDRAGYDLFGAMARKTPERIAWEQEYLKKREAETAKRRKERP